MIFVEKIQLIAFPYAGGSQAIYWPIKEHLYKHIDMTVLEPPGRGGRFSEPPFFTIQQMVDDAMNWFRLHKPKRYVLFGYSMGGIVAYELYFKLLEERVPLPFHIFFAACDIFAKEISDVKIEEMTVEEFITYLNLHNGTPKEVLENSELLELLIPYVKADFIACGNYQFKEYKERIRCDVTILEGKEDRADNKPQFGNWKRCTDKNCSITYFDGDHFFIRDFPEKIAHEINNVCTK